MRRHPDVTLRRRHERSGIVVDDRVAAQVAQERANRGELAGGGGARVPGLMQLREEASQRLAIELRRMKIALREVGLRGGVPDELREIAFVGAHGVRRRVAVQPQVGEERFQVVDHPACRARPSGRAAIHASRSASARADSASLRSFFPFGAAASGWMIPNVMFDGS